MKKSKKPNQSEVFYNAGFAPSQIEYWNDYQSHLNKFGFQIIEYTDPLQTKEIWQCYLESSDWEAQEDLKKGFDGQRFNTRLAQQIKDREGYSNTYWETFTQNIKWRGYYVPVEDFLYFTIPQMKTEINHAFHLSRHFNLTGYLVALKKDSVDRRLVQCPLTLLGIWNFMTFYNSFLFECFDAKKIQHKPLTNWYSRNISFNNFVRFLPSKQLTELLFAVIESSYDSGKGSGYLYRLIKHATPTVKAFFDKHKEAVREWVDEQKGKLFSVEMKLDFLQICQQDRLVFSAMETVEFARHNTEQHIQLSDVLLRAFKKDKSGILDELKSALSKVSVIDMLWFDPWYADLKPKRYIPNMRRIDLPISYQWDQLDEYFVSNHKEMIETLPEEIRNPLDEKIQTNWQSYLMNLANSYTPPSIIWKQIHGEPLPQWNIPTNREAKNYKKVFFDKQESRAEQERRLKQQLLEMQKLKSKSEIQNYLDKVSPFFDPFLRNKWEMYVEDRQSSMQIIEKYRTQKMIELGISEKNETLDFKHEIWLDEMLQIEEEIKKYIPFVKKAFKSALPVRRTVEFNAMRHDKSGVEFDPTTINDQNKWLRGDVMKTLKVSVKKQEAEQINAFCLDLSGSMKHERMRNLYKILYLLVLGLEDRKSYDAFHFFNAQFIEGTNFSEDFTRRSLLFDILHNISDIIEGQVKYSGYYGTNISDGIDQCHRRILDFKEEMQKKKPEVEFLSSLFVITDGEPSMGITDLDELQDFVTEKRADGKVEIKGIYIKSKKDENNFMESIFGKDQFVETVEFDEAVKKFTSILSMTYKKQRNAFKWKMKKQSISGNK